MKKIILTFVILVGLYTLLRNNVFKLPDQIIWSSNFNFFYKVLLPSFMVIFAIFSLVKNSNHTLFYILMGLLVIDAIFRLSDGINHIHGYLQYTSSQPLSFSHDPATGSVLAVKNMWPSHIMGIIEFIMIYFCYKYLIKSVKIEMDS